MHHRVKVQKLNHPFIKITCVCLSEAILNSGINPPASSDIQPKCATALLYIIWLCIFYPNLQSLGIFLQDFHHKWFPLMEKKNPAGWWVSKGFFMHSIDYTVCESVKKYFKAVGY
jgi:hypothetical protein